jgi:hypothetical protein
MIMKHLKLIGFILRLLGGGGMGYVTAVSTGAVAIVAAVSALALFLGAATIGYEHSSRE